MTVVVTKQSGVVTSKLAAGVLEPVLRFIDTRQDSTLVSDLGSDGSRFPTRGDQEDEL